MSTAAWTIAIIAILIATGPRRRTDPSAVPRALNASTRSSARSSSGFESEVVRSSETGGSRVKQALDRRLVIDQLALGELDKTVGT